MLRRNFAKILGVGVLGTGTIRNLAQGTLLSSVENGARIPLGVCNHSLRGMRPTARDLIEFAIRENLDSVLLNTLQPFISLDKLHLQNLKSIAVENEISIYIGAGSISEKSKSFTDKYGNAEQLLIEGIRVAANLGSPIVGCRIGNIDDRYIDGGIEVHIELVINLMKSLKSRALDAGVKFAFENHAGDLRSSELLTIINETGTEICGALFDPANAFWALENPMNALDVLKTNILCTSVRDIQVWETNDGATFQGMAIGEGMLDFQEYAKTMAKFCPKVPLHVETISNSARPVPFLTANFWNGFPDLPASEMISFLQMIKKGEKQNIVIPCEDCDKKAFELELQKTELQKSFNYLRKYCNAGLKKI